METISMRAPLNEEFNGVLECHGAMYANRSTWRIACSDNPNVTPGMYCRTMNGRIEPIFENKMSGYKFGVAPNGRLFIEGKFKTRELYGTDLTVPHK